MFKLKLLIFVCFLTGCALDAPPLPMPSGMFRPVNPQKVVNKPEQEVAPIKPEPKKTTKKLRKKHA